MEKDKDKSTEILQSENLKNKIYTIRGVQVMLDSDLAEIYGYETKTLNQQVKNNIDKFPPDLMFSITLEELDVILKSKNLTSSLNRHGGRRKEPQVFTEQGVYMLMTVLKGELATKQSLTLVRVFREMRHFIADNTGVFQRLDRVETKILGYDEKFDQIFNQLEIKQPGNAAIFFAGTFYDAKSFIRDLVVKAKEKIILIDDYVSKVTLDILRNRNSGVKIILVTKQNPNNKDKLSEQEIFDFNKQYGNLSVIYNNSFHDRFLILDNVELYSIGASLKDAGNKTFAINKIDDSIIIKALLGYLHQDYSNQV